MQEKILKVSVCVVTFNQKDYIRECLDSLISQVTNFKFEIIVGDDGSTDGTAEIVADYARKYPDLVIPILHEKNIGAVANIISVYKKAQGKYIAHVDGDDFALPNKLQKQADILDDYSSCSICSHDVIRVENGVRKLSKSFPAGKAGIKNLADLYRKLPFFAHSSKMFVNDLSSPFYNSLSPETIDLEIHIEQAKYGNIFHIDEFLGGYNSQIGISFAGGRVNPYLPAAKRRVFEKVIREGCKDITRDELIVHFSKSMLAYAYQSARVGNVPDCRVYAIESLSIKIISPLQVIILISSYFPRVCIFLAKLRAKLI